MSDFVRPCCWFCIQKCSPQQDQDIKWVSASYVGSIWGSSTAILWSCWHRWHHLGAHCDAMWAQFGGYNSGIAKNHPKLYLQNALPQGPRGVTELISSKKDPKNKISSKTLFPMAGKSKRNQKLSKYTSPKS